MRLYSKNLSLKIEEYLIDQVSKMYLKLKKIICQKLKNKTKSNITKENFSKVKI